MEKEKPLSKKYCLQIHICPLPLILNDPQIHTCHLALKLQAGLSLRHRQCTSSQTCHCHTTMYQSVVFQPSPATFPIPVWSPVSTSQVLTHSFPLHLHLTLDC